MGDGHGSALFLCVPASRRTGADVGARGRNVRLGLSPGRRTAAGERGDHIIGVGSSYSEGLGKAGRRADGPPVGACVAGREDREDAGRSQGLHIGEESLVSSVVAAPGVVDRIGGVVGGGIAVRVQQPLKASVDPAIVGIALVVEGFGGDPPGAGSHADSSVAYDGAHGVSAMAVAVAGVRVAFIGGTEPVAGVHVQPLGAVTPVFGQQGRMLPVHAGVHVGHHHPAAVNAQGVPDQLGPYAGDVPLYRGKGQGQGIGDKG